MGQGYGQGFDHDGDQGNWDQDGQGYGQPQQAPSAAPSVAPSTTPQAYYAVSIPTLQGRARTAAARASPGRGGRAPCYDADHA